MQIPQQLEKYFVLVVVVGEAVVDLDGVHHEEVADEGDDELGAPVARPAEESGGRHGSCISLVETIIEGAI